MTINRPNQVWAANITYLPIAAAFLYLVAIIDWASRAVLAWRLSHDGRLVLRGGSGRGAGEVRHAGDFQTDQGGSSRVRPSPARWRGQGSRSPWMAAVVGWTTSSSSGCGGVSSMMDIYLKGYADGREAKTGIASWIAFYNDRRLHQGPRLSDADGGLARADARRQGCGHGGQR